MRPVRCWFVLLIAVCCATSLAAQGRSPALPPEAPPPLYRHDPTRTVIVNEWQPSQNVDQMRMLLVRQQSAPDDGFRPVSELPPDEKLPAGPMLVAAYVFVVLALFAYFVSLSRRLNAVNREISRLDAQIKRR